MDRLGTCIILDQKYNIANSSCHFGSYGSIWTGPYTAMTLSAMNYLLYDVDVQYYVGMLYGIYALHIMLWCMCCSGCLCSLMRMAKCSSPKLYVHSFDYQLASPKHC
jgi:hypothetical protein